MKRSVPVAVLLGALLAGPPIAAASAETARPSAREKATVTLINQARAKSRKCGGKRYAAARPVTISNQLTYAARKHAKDMGQHGYFAHESRNGDDPGDRMTAAGFRWRAYGEDIAAGQPTPAAVVAAWLKSPGHCQIIMTSSFRQVGLGFQQVRGSDYGGYWVADFGTKR